MAVEEEIYAAGSVFLEKLLGVDNYHRLLQIKANYKFSSIPCCVGWLLKFADNEIMYDTLDSETVSKNHRSSPVYATSCAGDMTLSENVNLRNSTGRLAGASSAQLDISDEQEFVKRADSDLNLTMSSHVEVTTKLHEVKIEADHVQDTEMGENHDTAAKVTHVWAYERRPTQCDVCGKILKKAGNLKDHMLIHSMSKPYVCDLCGRAFAHRGNFRRHEMVHSGIKPHECDKCGKKFPEKRALIKHKRLHDGTQPYKCDDCDKRFNDASGLATHKMSRHSDARPHQCNICGKGFKIPGNLNQHMLIHTGVKPLKCDICGKAFSHSGHLKRHRACHENSTTASAVSFLNNAAGTPCFDAEMPKIMFCGNNDLAGVS